MSSVLKHLDKNGDGAITLDELEAVGLEGLPNFDELGAEGHHYDVESGASNICSPRGLLSNFMRHAPEFFLHHEGNGP